MPPLIATVVYTLGILALFWLDRDRKVRTSMAIWLPVIWIWIAGSRNVSDWLGISPPNTVSQLLEGSPLDALVFAVLIAAGIIVLIRRSRRTRALLKANWVILLYFFFCLLSVIWSDFPGVAFKRWTKAIGDLVMVLIVATDPKPAAALRRLMSRTGFVLLPASLLLIKYFNDLGRGYDPWTGEQINRGVAANKNMLGVITFVLSLGTVWSILVLLRHHGQPNRNRHLLAQGILLAFGIALLVMAHSATAAACFAFGAGLMVATSLPFFGRRPGAVHALVLMIVFVGGLTMLFGGDAGVVHAMGRGTDFTGRTVIWEAVIPMAPNPILGAGFESFWLGPRLDKMWRAFPAFQPNEAHNGYIEVYLNLGCAGLCLMVLILIIGYRRAAAAFRRDPAIGAMMLAYVVTAVIYAVTEAGFRMLHPMWIFLLLSIVGANGVTSAAGGKARRPRGVTSDVPPLLSPHDTLVPVGKND